VIESVGSAAPLGVSHYKGGKLGIIRLDYDYPPAPGDIDSWESFDYEVVYACVPGLTFHVCMDLGQVELKPEVEEQLKEAVSLLIGKGVHGITGDCGFMMYLQDRIREMAGTRMPVFMSALAQLPAIECAFGKGEKIAIFTASRKNLVPMHDLICSECGGLDTNSDKFVIVGCEEVTGFEAVELAKKVDVPRVTPGIVDLAMKTLEANPEVRAFLMECTDLPPYSDAVRAETGLPVYDAITASNFFMSGVQDNPRFGLNDFQKTFDGQENTYRLGLELSGVQKSMLKTQTMTQKNLAIKATA